MSITLDDIQNAILAGVADGNENTVREALKLRRDVLSSKKRSSLSPGDLVVFNDTARPKYLQGIKATVVRVNKSRIIVRIGPEGGRFANSEPACPVSIIDPVKA